MEVEVIDSILEPQLDLNEEVQTEELEESFLTESLMKNSLEKPNFEEILKDSPEEEEEEGEEFNQTAWNFLDSLLKNLNLCNNPLADHPLGWNVKEYPLYRYQRKSLAKMLQMEMTPQCFNDPFWELTSNGNYRNLISGFYVNKIPTINAPRGGVLCEDMGTGKTAICLALILSTKGTIAKPPPGGGQHYFTDDVPQRWDGNRYIYQPLSLVELCARVVKYCPGHPSLPTHILPLELQEFIEKIPRPFYIFAEYFSSIRSPSEQVSKIFLSSTTLLVVPSSLVDQWLGEIHKFIIPGFLKTLVLRSFTDWNKFSVNQICDYDLVITPHNNLRGNHDKMKKIFQIRWLRIIFDEGHVLGHASKQATTSTNLSIERRWCCSGTPVPTGILTKELKDLFGLVTFLQLEPFSLEKAWNKIIVGTILSKEANRQEFGKRLLNEVINLIFVRNSDEEIYSDVTLPSCHIKITSLKFQAHEKARYNELLSLIRINLLSSKGVGVDSLMSPENVRYALEAITNIRRTCFHIDPMTDDQRKLALGAIRDAERAHQSGKEVQSEKSLKELEELWNLLNTPTPDMSVNKVIYCAGCCVWRDKKIVKRLPSSFIDLLHEKEEGEFDDLPLLDWVEKINTVSNLEGSSRKSFDDIETTETEDFRSPKRRKIAFETPNKFDKTTESRFSTTRSRRNSNGQLVQYETTRNSAICSTKLNYLMSRLEELIPDEKCIIFTSLTDTLGFILDAMDHSDINFVEFHTKMDPSKRSSVINQFNTKPEIRVIVMKTELAAYGINLIAASRIFILEPAWSISMEQQAIKRAHRIGQTKEVFVEKLVVESSIEEIMVNLLDSIQLDGSQSEITERKVHSLLTNLKLIGYPTKYTKDPCFWNSARHNVKLIEVGQIVEAKSIFQKNYHHAWCKAQVLQILGKDEIEVKLLDFNEIEILPRTNLRRFSDVSLLSSFAALNLPLFTFVEYKFTIKNISTWWEAIIIEKTETSIILWYRNNLFNKPPYQNYKEITLISENDKKSVELRLPSIEPIWKPKELNRLQKKIKEMPKVSENSKNELGVKIGDYIKAIPI